MEIRERSRWDDLAAESWAALAVIFSLSERRELGREVEADTSAIALSAVSSRKAVFHLNLASLMLKDQDCDRGRQEVENGIGLNRSPDKVVESRLGTIQKEWDAAGCSGQLPDPTT